MNGQNATKGKQYVVNCTKCCTALKVEVSNLVYQCPRCHELFRVRLATRLTMDITPDPVLETYVRVDKKNGKTETQSVSKTSPWETR